MDIKKYDVIYLLVLLSYIGYNVVVVVVVVVV